MERKIVDNIRDLYELLTNSITEIEKMNAINNFKLGIGLNTSDMIGDYYARTNGVNKGKGVVYTPVDIAKYIIENTVSAEDIIKNPFLKILDPACGCGSIIIQCFFYLMSLYKENLNLINRNSEFRIYEEDIPKHIIDNNLFGKDIDEIALYILQIDLFSVSKCVNTDNYQLADFLINNYPKKFDIIVGNPPYVGHKSIDKSYSELIRREYGHVFRDKGDLSYCFFSKAIDSTTEKGKITFINSRYFMESSSGIQLRILLSEKIYIKKIVDFYGMRPFKGIGIDPVILFIRKEQCENIEVFKPDIQEMSLKKQLKKDVNNIFNITFKKFYLKNSDLNEENWVLVDNITKNIIRKIEKKCTSSLGSVCNSYQGIITGCDKAFIVTEDVIRDKKLEIDLIRPWIKSSHINIVPKDKKKEYIIYTNFIQNELMYPHTLEHVSIYKDKLMNRRECKNGVRRWFELQWGRNAELFEREKIIFPYKSSTNRFALDKGSYFSADIYAITINDLQQMSYDYLLFILNSKLYEFYFKTFAKKLGGNLYEYYPNNLMKLKIPDMWERLYWNDEYLFEYFELTNLEINNVLEKGNQ